MIELREAMPVTQYTDPEYFERLDGAEYPKVSSQRTHSLVQAAFLRILSRLAPDKEIGPEWKFRIGKADGTDAALLPDVAYVEKRRIQALGPDEREEPPFAPDVAIEIRSPGERRWLREEKIRRYLRTGARLVVDVDPKRRAIYAHTHDATRTFRMGDRFESGAFAWLAFDVREVFAELGD